eukprot:gnl/TRDRNA2_/TRDRNA2_144877_c0_seq1.p1 gnl/TRDRNA2_/TRDRNA2_144877_c0~~gnl/TRDRNA2_/TRDRNA2_144877_c0_seq1.p1  ORF type:complete len:316 (-),score=32.38 gnl/TRDRNA2_/TRDRNA2_144877_c0_seq1:31-927(-)
MIANKPGKDGIARLRIDCRPGDVFLVNTHLWKHQTTISSTKAANSKLSLSVARDFDLEEDNGNKFSSIGDLLTSPAGYSVDFFDLDDQDVKLLQQEAQAVKTGTAVACEHESPRRRRVKGTEMSAGGRRRAEIRRRKRLEGGGRRRAQDGEGMVEEEGGMVEGGANRVKKKEGEEKGRWQSEKGRGQRRRKAACGMRRRKQGKAGGEHRGERVEVHNSNTGGGRRRDVLARSIPSASSSVGKEMVVDSQERVESYGKQSEYIVPCVLLSASFMFSLIQITRFWFQKYSRGLKDPMMQM